MNSCRPRDRDLQNRAAGRLSASAVLTAFRLADPLGGWPTVFRSLVTTALALSTVMEPSLGRAQTCDPTSPPPGPGSGCTPATPEGCKSCGEGCGCYFIDQTGPTCQSPPCRVCGCGDISIPDTCFCAEDGRLHQAFAPCYPADFVQAPLPPSAPSCGGGGGDGGCPDGGSDTGCQCDPGDPVSVASGNLFFERSDLRIDGYGTPLLFERYYNSLNTYDHGLGTGWTYSYSSHILLVPAAGTSAAVDSPHEPHNAFVIRDDGATYRFAWQPAARASDGTPSAASCDGLAGPDETPDTHCYGYEAPCVDNETSLCFVGGTTGWRAQLAWYAPAWSGGDGTCEFALTAPNGDLSCYARDPTEPLLARLASIAYPNGHLIQISRSPSDPSHIETVRLQLANGLRIAAGENIEPVDAEVSMEITWIGDHISQICPVQGTTSLASHCQTYLVTSPAGVSRLESASLTTGEIEVYQYGPSPDLLDATSSELAVVLDGEGRTALAVVYDAASAGVVAREQSSRTLIERKNDTRTPCTSGLDCNGGVCRAGRCVGIDGRYEVDVCHFDSEEAEGCGTVTVGANGVYLAATQECGCTSGATLGYATTSPSYANPGDIRIDTRTDFAGNRTTHGWDYLEPDFGYRQRVVSEIRRGISGGTGSGAPIRVETREWSNDAVVQPLAGLPVQAPITGLLRLTRETRAGRPDYSRDLSYTYCPVREADGACDCAAGPCVETGVLLRDATTGATPEAALTESPKDVVTTVVTERELGPTGVVSAEHTFSPDQRGARSTRFILHGEAECQIAVGSNVLDRDRLCEIQRRIGNGLSLVWQFGDYDVLGTPRWIRSPDGQVTTRVVDVRGRVTDTSFPDGSTAHSEFDGGGLVSWRRRRSGFFDVNVYDPKWRRLTAVVRTSLTSSGVPRPVGEKLVFAHDSSGRVTAESHLLADGTEVFRRRRSYGSRGRLVLETTFGPPDGVTVRTYNGDQNLETVWRQGESADSDLGRLRVMTYDALQRLESVATCSATSVATTCPDPAPSKSTYAYDSVLDTITSVTVDRRYPTQAPDLVGGGSGPSLEPVLTEYAWDDFGRLVEVVSPDSGRTRYAYNAVGDVRLRLGPERGDWFHHDDLGRLRNHGYYEVPGYALHDELELRYFYDETDDSQGRLSRVVGPDTTRALTYDSMGAIESETLTVRDPEAQEHTFATAYQQSAGLLRTVTLPSGQTLHLSYDLADRVVRIGAGSRGTTTLVEQARYGPSGALRSYRAGNGLATTLARDLSERITRISAAPTGGSPLFDQRLAYNPDGSIATFETPGKRSDRLFYDPMGELTQWRTSDDSQSELPGTRETRIVYDGAGNRIFEEHGQYELVDDALLYVTDEVLSYVLETSSNRVDQILDSAAPETAQSEVDTHRTFDGAGRVLSEEILVQEPDEPAPAQSALACYEYSLPGRLTAIREASLPMGGGERSCDYTRIALAEYIYDDLGRRVFSRDIETPETSRFFVYDRTSLLVAEADSRGDVTREYAYLGATPIAILDLAAPQKTGGCDCRASQRGGGSFAALAMLFWSVSVWRRRRRLLAPPARERRRHLGRLVVPIIASVLLGSASMGCLESADAQDGSSFIYYLHTDHRGAPTMATDQNREVVWQATYEPFGRVHIEPGARIEVNLRYPGQYQTAGGRELLTGRPLYYNWHRYYDPDTGRYLTPEPMATKRPGWNQPVFAYALNSPVRFTDRTGLVVKLCRRPADLPIPVDHHWIETNAGSGGMGACGEGVPGHGQVDSPYATDTCNNDHAGEDGPDVTCELIYDVDEECVNAAILKCQELGKWSAWNQCQSYAADVLDQCRRDTNKCPQE